MSDPRQALREQLSEQIVPAARVSALLELAYTASEGGLIPFDIRDDSAKELIALVMLAEKFESGVPENLRM